MYKNMKLVEDQQDQHADEQNGERVPVYGRRRRGYDEQFCPVGSTGMYGQDLLQN
jgi:hypothetical protein